MNETTVTYQPDRLLKEGRLALWKEMFRQLSDSRELGYRLFVRDLIGRYKQSLFGLLWILITPVFTSILFVALNMAGILNIQKTDIPYPVYVLISSTIWSLLLGLMTSFAASVNVSAALIIKINFPRIALIHSPFLISLLDFLLRFGLLVPVMYMFGVTPDIMGILLFPLAMLPLILFSVGAGLFFAPVGAVIKDITNIIPMILNLVLYATPILYPLPSSGILREVSLYNPFYHLVTLPRDILVQGPGAAAHMTIYLAFTCASVIMLFGGWKFYHIALSRIAEKV